MSFNLLDSLSTFMVLFAVIDIVGSIPIILDIKAKGNIIESGKISFVSFGILLLFLFVGEQILGVFGVDISSFAIAGSLILFILSLEMILGITLFKPGGTKKGATIVPIAFPLVAGAGSITSLLSLKAEYDNINIIVGLILNMFIVFIVLKLTEPIGRILGESGVLILKKVFGIILLAIAIRLFMSNFANSVEHFLPGIIEAIKKAN